MSINGITSASTLSQVSALSTLSNPSGTDAAQGTTSTPASSSNVSKPGELFAKLSQLQQTDPTKFKQVTQQIADQLKTAASSASGPQAQFLTKLSDNFAQASTSGTLDSLQPPASGEHRATVGGHHHHGGGSHSSSGGGGIESVLSSALAEVNQALSSATPS